MLRTGYGESEPEQWIQIPSSFFVHAKESPVVRIKQHKQRTKINLTADMIRPPFLIVLYHIVRFLLLFNRDNHLRVKATGYFSVNF